MVALNRRPLVPETSTRSICSWFARYLAAPQRTQMSLIRQLSFPNLSTISACRVRRKSFSRNAQTRPQRTTDDSDGAWRRRYRCMETTCSAFPTANAAKQNTSTGRVRRRTTPFVGAKRMHGSCVCRRLDGSYTSRASEAVSRHVREASRKDLLSD